MTLPGDVKGFYLKNYQELKNLLNPHENYIKFSQGGVFQPPQGIKG